MNILITYVVLFFEENLKLKCLETEYNFDFNIVNFS